MTDSCSMMHVNTRQMCSSARVCPLQNIAVYLAVIVRAVLLRVTIRST